CRSDGIHLARTGNLVSSNSMPVKRVGKVSSIDALAFILWRRKDRHTASPMQERHGTQNRPACLQAAIPGDHHIIGYGEGQLLPADKCRAAALEHCCIKATLPVDGIRGRAWHHDQIADTPDAGHNRFGIAELLRPTGEAAIEPRPSGSFRNLVALSPV